MKQARGNALFLILIAVALFAALSYAVTQSGRGSGTITRENDAINASRVMQFTASVRGAVQKMRLLSGCADNGISFESANWVSLGFNATYTYSPDVAAECKVFNPAGGGVTLQQMPDGFSPNKNYFITGAYAVTGVGTDGGGAASSELMILARNISKDACIQINNKLGITNPSGAPPAMSFNLACGNGPGDTCSVANETFNGTYASNMTFAHAALQRQEMACAQAVGTNNYFYYMVLIPR